MLRTRMATLTIILSELFPPDGFRCDFVSAPQLKNRLEYFDDISQLCRTCHDGVSRTRMTTLAFIIFQLFSLYGFRSNFMSPP